MAKKGYEWLDGAVLEEHSKRKHKILREYFFKYLLVRCQLPTQEKFRLAIVDGFSGGGRYQCGSPGSPIIFIEELQRAIDVINLKRIDQGMPQIQIECLLFFNDDDIEAIETLKKNIAPALEFAKETNQKLHLHAEFRSNKFDLVYLEVKELLRKAGYRNVIFNLDQCGHKHVNAGTLKDIIQSNPKVEIFYTFFITSLLAFLEKANPTKLEKQLASFSISKIELTQLSESKGNQAWLGAAERLVFQVFKDIADYVSPFSINNPEGWRYWLIHFARSYRARQVYNDTLHENSTSQAHFGRSGLNMLSYDPRDESNSLYLFDVSGRKQALLQLEDDIPRLISDFGDVVGVSDFYESIYNDTPAHTDDVHAAIINNPDLEVLTPFGGERRRINTISVGDTIKLKRQTSFFPMFPRK